MPKKGFDKDGNFFDDLRNGVMVMLFSVIFFVVLLSPGSEQNH